MSELIRKGYKVVRKLYDGTFWSATGCATGGWDTQRNLEYKIGEKTYPQALCGPLAVFSQFSDAHDFVEFIKRCNGKYLIFKCHYNPSKENGLWIKKRGILDHTNPPMGTDLANWVELLEVIP